MKKKPSEQEREPGAADVEPQEEIAPDEILPEYDFRGGIRGKYAERYAEGTNIVVLDPDVAAAFSDSVAVNSALRALLRERARK